MTMTEITATLVRRHVKFHIQKMVVAMRYGKFDLVKLWAKDVLVKVLDGGSAYMRFATIDQDNIKLLELLILVGFVDKGEALTASCAEGKLAFAHLLLKNFGERVGYVDNNCDEWGRSPLVSSIGKGQVKMVRLLLDYGVNAEAKIVLYPGGSEERRMARVPNLANMYSARRVISVARMKYPTRADAIEKMLLQIPAIRGNSFGWPVKSELKSELKSEMIGEEFSKFLIAMRRRVSRKPLVFVRVNEPEI